MPSATIVFLDPSAPADARVDLRALFEHSEIERLDQLVDVARQGELRVTLDTDRFRFRCHLYAPDVVLVTAWTSRGIPH